MTKFNSLKLAARFALRSSRPTYVFNGPDSNYIVASGKAAKELMDDGHKPLSLWETAQAA